MTYICRASDLEVKKQLFGLMMQTYLALCQPMLLGMVLSFLMLAFVLVYFGLRNQPETIKIVPDEEYDQKESGKDKKRTRYFKLKEGLQEPIKTKHPIFVLQV